ncbi:hypothetical protein RB601_002973 [Gaeumannomyces tritici]
MAIPRRRWHFLLPQAAMRKLASFRDRTGRRRIEARIADASPLDTDPHADPADPADPPPTAALDATQQSQDCVAKAERKEVVPAAKTSDELESRADPQLSALFFSRLPPEVRRLIYIEVFRAFTDGSRRIHVSAEDNHCAVSFAPCILDHSHPQQDQADGGAPRGPLTMGNVNERNILVDANVHANGGRDPAHWWWWRWSLRLRWGDHMDCVSRAVGSPPGPGPRPAAMEGTAPLRAMFLTCNRMYTESITTLFETTAFLFKSSTDAARFLKILPHRYTHLIRFIEFNFIYDKDCLYLQPIEPVHPRITFAAAKETPAVGIAVWNNLVGALASAVPELSNLKVFIGAKPTADKEEFLEAFETVGWRPRNLQLRFRDE